MDENEGGREHQEVVYRKLGNTGFDTSTVGFGMWQLGGGRWRAQSSRECITLLQQALDLGINIYDAAVVYGQYADERHYLQSRSQELLGDAFADRRDRVYYCIKLGQYDELSHRSLYEPGRIVEQLQQSLRRLRTDVADICLIHAPSLADVEQGAALAILKTVQALGLVRAIGYSFENEPQHVLAALSQRVDVIMLQYNLIDTQCALAMAKAADQGIGLLVGGPYKRGYLTGRFRTVSDLPTDDDYWRWNLQKNPGKVQKILSQVNEMRAEYACVTDLRRAALSFVLEGAGVASAIVGHRSLDEVMENIAHAGGLK